MTGRCRVCMELKLSRLKEKEVMLENSMDEMRSMQHICTYVFSVGNNKYLVNVDCALGYV